ncbi:PREDICTED: sodium-dependent lysophosphatidylcholine symporter 1-B-like [Amphimedon queenslandica]|uniref:Major facilitator superfamily (MFS) profile domain-containing protein n=2 Tax=Amphimedon queenslandica TaxID=400682 RepID=A0AAN0IGL3_AMPQE|nr:PREDICTED: sodium-dependent lysophosphatidylcholine symporter 1-B-like [Amphimedon queenslandica]|eukprot:XP_003388138.2 PREDICTED: sodium-dependent lysophosphatidylcholine symporter 1-B-like [Amphimedon queenslandica]
MSNYFKISDKNHFSQKRDRESLDLMPDDLATKVKDEKRLPLWRKLGYAMGSMPYAMCNTVIGFYFTYFLLEAALMDATYVLVIILLGRVWDAISDPLCGYFCSRTKTRFGQFRPWLLISAVPAALVYFGLWFVPNFSSSALTFIYYLIMYLLFQTMLTCVHVPYTALTMHMSYSQKEIDSVTFYRVAFETIATLLGVTVYTISYAIFAHESSEDCTGTKTKDSNLVKAFRYHALFMSVLIVIMILTTFFTVKEQKEMTDKKTKISLREAMKETWCFKPYRELFCIELFSWLAVQFGQGNLAFYIQYNLDLGNELPYFVFYLMVVNIIVLPLWQLTLQKFGKKTAFHVAAWFLLPSYLSFLFIDYYPHLIWIVGFIQGSGASAIYMLPWSMIPDVVDYASLHSGIRREELYYSFFVFGNKFSSGITLGLSTGIYKLANYNQLSCEQPWTATLLFKLLVSTPTVLFILVTLVFLWRYPITEMKRIEIKEKILSLRKGIKIQSEQVYQSVEPVILKIKEIK